MNLLARVPAPLTKVLGRQLLHTQKASPTLLFAGGVVGVVATTILASRATLKISSVLEGTEDNIRKANLLHARKDEALYSDADYQRDMTIIYSRAAVNVVKLYGPAVVVGTLSIAALTGSHVMLNRRYAAVSAAYAALDKGFREYRRRVVDELGEDQDRKFRYGGETTKARDVEAAASKDVAKTRHLDPNQHSVYARFFDELSSSWNHEPEYNYLFLRCQQNYMNDLLRARGHVFLNEVYDRLGIPRSRPGAVVGWVMDGAGDNFIDFGIFDGHKPRARDFVNGREGSVLLDFNVDGIIYDKI